MERVGVVFIVATAGGHGPASHLGPVGHWILGRAGGPGGVACRPSGRAHSSQIEGHVLGSSLLEGRLHHLQVVILLEPGPDLSLILKEVVAQISVRFL